MLVQKQLPSYYKGGEFRKVRGFEDTVETVVFHTGTAFSVGRLVTSCGRVLGVTSLGTTIKEH